MRFDWPNWLNVSPALIMTFCDPDDQAMILFITVEECPDLTMLCSTVKLYKVVLVSLEKCTSIIIQ
jgi:hypothetical protein